MVDSVDSQGDRLTNFVRFLTALALAWSAAASADAPTSVNGWTIDEDIGRLNFTPLIEGARNTRGQVSSVLRGGLTVAYLVRQPDGSWQASVSADASQPGVEAIWMRYSNKTIGLAAMGTALTSSGDQQSVCNMRHTADRSKVGYSLCNSELTSEIHDLGVLLTPLHLLTGKIAAFRVDREKFAAALSPVDIDALYAAIEQEAAATAAAERQATAERRASAERQAAAERLETEQVLKAWRAGLQSGDRTLCGIVVDVREAVISIQVPQSGLKWIRRDSAMPVGASSNAIEVAMYCGSH